MSVYITSIDEVVDPLADFDKNRNLREELFELQEDVGDLEMLIDDLTDDIGHRKNRIAEIGREIAARKDMAVAAVALA